MLYVLEYCFYIGTLDRSESLGSHGNGGRHAIMEYREYDSIEKLVLYDFFGDSNTLDRMVDNLGQSVGNVGTTIFRHSFRENIFEAK